jgi:glucose/mannose-6-phosphate isomerase
MLDDLKMIHNRDVDDALGVASAQWEQLKYHYSVDISSSEYENITNIVLAGMGGSALAALMFTTWPKMLVPFEISRDYDLPPTVTKNSLFIASSYSGNTEETLEALTQAEAVGCKIIVIAAGGALSNKAREKGYPLFEIPGGYQPRMAVFYNFAALVQLYDVIAGNAEKTEELRAAADWLGERAKSLLADVPTASNQAKQLAQELVGNSIVIYSGPKLFSAAYKWKINFNENSKNIAWCNQLPEFNHNEFLGWTSHPVDKPYKVVDLRSSLEHPRVLKRFEISERLLSGRRPSPEVVIPEGDTLLQQLLWTIQLGDFVSLYLALLNGLNPTPVELIEKLKNELKN